jgi:hypothetical protein
MSTLPDDYARCHGKGLGGGYAMPWPECLDCLRRTAPMRDNVLYSYMAPPEFTTTCPERIAP